MRLPNVHTSTAWSIILSWEYSSNTTGSPLRNSAASDADRCASSSEWTS